MKMMMMGSKGDWELGQPRFCDSDRGTNEPHKRVGHVSPHVAFAHLRQHLDADISTSDAIPIFVRL